MSNPEARRRPSMSRRMDRRSFLKVTAGAAALGGAAFPPRRSEGQDKRTLVVARDTDIDTLDPAHFKAIGGSGTFAHCYHIPLGRKELASKVKPGVFRPRSAGGGA